MLDEDVSQYGLEVSCNGGNFTTLANIASTKKQYYSFTDREFCTGGTRYYRLKTTNKSGEVEWSDIIKVSRTGKAEVKLYPNPATSGVLQLQTNINGIATIKIVDVLGRERVTTTKNMLGINSINISSLERGLYFLQIIQNNEITIKTFSKY